MIEIKVHKFQNGQNEDENQLYELSSNAEKVDHKSLFFNGIITVLQNNFIGLVSTDIFPERITRNEHYAYPSNQREQAFDFHILHPLSFAKSYPTHLMLELDILLQFYIIVNNIYQTYIIFIIV